MNTCTTHQFANGFLTSRYWQRQTMRAGVLSALILAGVFTNLDTAFGQQRGRTSRGSRTDDGSPGTANNGLGATRQDDRPSSRSRQKTSRMVAALNSEIRKANRNGDADRALNASLEKLRIALRCSYNLPKTTWVRKSCEVIIATLEMQTKDDKKKEVQSLLAEAQAALLAIKEQKRSKQNAELLQLVASCNLRLAGELAPAHTELVSRSIADSYLSDIAYGQIKDDRMALQRLTEVYSSLEKKLRLAGVARELRGEIALRLAECQFLLSDYKAAAALHKEAVALLNKLDQFSDRLSQMRVALGQFGAPDSLKERRLRWLRELVEHGAVLTIEDPTTDSGVNRKLAQLGLTNEKIRRLVMKKLLEQKIKIFPAGSPGPGLHISVRVGAVPNDHLGMVMYSTQIDIGQTVIIPSARSEIQHATLYSPKSYIGLSAVDRFSDDVFEDLSRSLEMMAKDIENAKGGDRLIRHDRGQAARRRAINNGATEESFEKYQRADYLQEVAENGVFTSRVLFAPMIRRQPWFARNGLTVENVIQIVEKRLRQRHIKVVSSIEMNRLTLAGRPVCWLSPVPYVANGKTGETELTAYAIHLELLHPFAYLSHAGENPFVGRIMTPATMRRMMGSGVGSMHEQFEKDLVDLVDRFATVVNKAASK